MLDGSTTTLPRRRVSIIIRDFPLDIWHPMYFRQATTGIGAMVGMVPDTMAGGNKLAVKLVIECHNPNLIPPIITLYHNDKQTVYEVIVEGRGLLGEGQLAPPTPPPGGGYQRPPLQPEHDQLFHIAPYIPATEGAQMPVANTGPKQKRGTGSRYQHVQAAVHSGLRCAMFMH